MNKVKFKDSINAYTLYRGIVLGISGLLALFLTILFVVKGSAMFPATAALAWAIMAYICVDFGFIGKIVALEPGDLNIWRAGSEVFLATSLVIFFYAYLHLNRWNTRYNYLVLTWMIGMLVLFGIAVIAPSYAAGIARVSIAVAAVFGLILIFILSLRGFDRAILLIPSWCLILAWVVFGILLIGRHFEGWRGKRAVRLYLRGFAVLCIAYFGNRFILEEIFHRSWG